eukprot:m51a1_g8969 hypothetical protein (1042) ;mRNA; f:13240-18468
MTPSYHSFTSIINTVNNRSMKVFVTGATGYIGSEVVKELLSRGHSVTALVRGDASRAPQGTTAVVGTVENSFEWTPVAVQHDAIIHCAFDLAGFTAHGDSATGYQETRLTVLLAEAAKKAGRTKVMVITTTTGAVSGQPGIPDEYSATDRVSALLRPRIDGEALFLATSSEGFRACSVRPSGVYGGRGGLIKMLAGPETPSVVGDGSAEVSLVSVHDLARLYVFIVENDRCVGAFHGIGDGDYTTWRDLATRISLAKGLQGKITSSKRPQEMGFAFRGPRLMDAFDEYWKDGDGSGGSPLFGVGGASVDLYATPGSEWERHRLVMRPTGAEAAFSVGLYQMAGSCDFSAAEARLVQAEPFALPVVGRLGAAEQVSSAGVYTARMGGESPTTNSYSFIRQVNASWNTNRFCFWGAYAIVLDHSKVSGTFRSGANVTINVNYAAKGAIQVHSSPDMATWTAVGTAGQVKQFRFTLPSAQHRFVRLQTLGDASIQFDSYVFQAALQGVSLSNDPTLVVPAGSSVTTTLTYAVGSGRADDMTIVVKLVKTSDTSVVWDTLRLLPQPVYFLDDQSYGEVVATAGTTSIWWCRSTHKVSRSRELPLKTSTAVRISAAAGEYEPFQIVAYHSGSELQSWFELSPENIRDYHGLSSWAAVEPLYDKYLESFSKHRVSPNNAMSFHDVSYEVKVVSGQETMVVDWSDFDAYYERYFGDSGFGFNVYTTSIPGMNGGNFVSHDNGTLNGHPWGSPEHTRLFDAYLQELQSHLEAKGVLNKTIVYWFDEPEESDYPYVRDGMAALKRGAPKLTRMLTEQPTSDLAGYVDLWCPIINAYDPTTAHQRQQLGEKMWIYVCCCPKEPWLGLFIDRPATELRLWLWYVFQQNIQGILVWSSNYWTSSMAYPTSLQDPYEDPMSWVSSGWNEEGKKPWGNGDGRFLYPPYNWRSLQKPVLNASVVESLRWEMIREGIEDWEYLRILAGLASSLPAGSQLKAAAEQLAQVPEAMIRTTSDYSWDPVAIYDRREAVAEMIETILSGGDVPPGAGSTDSK